MAQGSFGARCAGHTTARRLIVGDRGDELEPLLDGAAHQCSILEIYRTLSGMLLMAWRTCLARSTASFSLSFEFCFKASATRRMR
jgi:hypothetical protein